jgi:hypothetical protein
MYSDHAAKALEEVRSVGVEREDGLSIAPTGVDVVDPPWEELAWRTTHAATVVRPIDDLPAVEETFHSWCNQRLTPSVSDTASEVR